MVPGTRLLIAMVKKTVSLLGLAPCSPLQILLAACISSHAPPWAWAGLTGNGPVGKGTGKTKANQSLLSTEGFQHIFRHIHMNLHSLKNQLSFPAPSANHSRQASLPWWGTKSFWGFGKLWSLSKLLVLSFELSSAHQKHPHISFSLPEPHRTSLLAPPRGNSSSTSL